MKPKYKRNLMNIMKWLMCPVCGSSYYLFRVKTFDYRCRKCGTLFKVNWSTKTTRRKTVKELGL